MCSVCCSECSNVKRIIVVEYMPLIYSAISFFEIKQNKNVT